MTEDLATIIEMLGHRLDDRAQKQAIREADPAGSGELQFERFAMFASKYVDVEEDVEAVAKELREAFLLYDRDCKQYQRGRGGEGVILSKVNRSKCGANFGKLFFSQRLHHR